MKIKQTLVILFACAGTVVVSMHEQFYVSAWSVKALYLVYPGCQRSSRSPAARNVRVSSADRRETSGSGS